MTHNEKLCDRNQDIFKQMKSKEQNKIGILEIVCGINC